MAEVSRELLVHFQCQIPSCKGWWTIGDPQARLVQEHEELSTRTWWCPWCGNHQVVTPSQHASPRLSLADEEKRQRLWQEYVADPADDVWKEDQQG
jgi:hypothetical protein